LISSPLRGGQRRGFLYSGGQKRGFHFFLPISGGESKRGFPFFSPPFRGRHRRGFNGPIYANQAQAQNDKN